ncbi:hypothetical protein AM493_17770 [Flavobacterium akiainvivens]|uniref:Uncharacterized protein n=1 Tax=Flavobacterium akiainvivens TaxID=1202724 RepID=A0A0M8MD51_9FLAO|nr:hypothetical protein [Flavobacterium akiainvivens]KOS07685.1 hypothetical protein AM493_17770 [Flavobacterium akiainvivens]SFQ24226.1 hypothetical protein SAMN05444144_102135 [Flavobacterium akiainvivens]
MRSLKHIIFAGLLLLLSVQANAQCAMCRAALETGGDTGQAEAVNDGIVYLMIFPYLLVGVVGFAIYRLYTKKKKPLAEAES